jgi:hypothetical protein
MTVIDVPRAVRSNRTLLRGVSVGGVRPIERFNQIIHLLGFTNQTPGEEQFAQSVGNWQSRNLPATRPDGMLGENTWRKMEPLTRFSVDLSTLPAWVRNPPAAPSMSVATEPPAQSAAMQHFEAMAGVMGLSAADDLFLAGFITGLERAVSDTLAQQLARKIRAEPVDFMAGVGAGYFSGLYSGLKGLLEGIWMILELGVATSPANLMRLGVTEAFLLLTDATHRELRSQQIEQARSLAAALEATVQDMATHPAEFLELSANLGLMLGEHVGDSVEADLLSRDAKGLGELAGSIYGQIAFEVLFEVLLAVGTAGAGNAARVGVAAGQATRGASRLSHLAARVRPVIERLPGLRRLISALSRERQVARAGSATHVVLSEAEYLAALGRVFPSHHFNDVLRLIDDIGQQAGRVASRDPEFLRLVQQAQQNPRQWNHAGNRFHNIAQEVAEGMGPTPSGLPPGWRMEAEFTVQSRRGGSRSDVLLR